MPTDLHACVDAAIRALLAGGASAEQIKRSVIVQQFQGNGVSRRTLFRWVDAALKALRPARRAVDLVLPAGLEAVLPAHVVLELRITAATAVLK